MSSGKWCSEVFISFTILRCKSSLVRPPVGQLLLLSFQWKKGWNVAELGRGVIGKEARVRYLPHRLEVTTISIFHRCGNLRSHIFLVKISNVASSCPWKHLRGLDIRSRIFLFHAPRNDQNSLQHHVYPY